MSRHLRTTKRAQLGLAVGAAVLACFSAGGTYALWTDTGSKDNGVITSGDLDIALSGSTIWTQTSPDVAGTPAVIDSSTFLATGGDTFTVRQDFVSLLSGENIRGKITTRWSTAPSLPAGVTATYRLLTAAGAALPGSASTPVAIGTTKTMTDLPATAGTTYRLEITLVFAANKANRYTAAVETTNLGVMTFDLDQIRTGTGYIP